VAVRICLEVSSWRGFTCDFKEGIQINNRVISGDRINLMDTDLVVNNGVETWYQTRSLDLVDWGLRLRTDLGVPGG